MSELLLLAVPGSTPPPERAPVVRVVVVPRLDERASLAGTAMADWPALLAAARFDVELGQGPPLTDLAPRHAADSTVWQAFLGRVRVRAAPSPGAVGPPPVVEPTSAHAVAIDATYRDAAAADIGVDAADTAALDDAVAQALDSRWREDGPPPAPPPPASAPPAGEQDFHQVLSLLREHPRVGRALGLVFELLVDPDRLKGAAAKGTVTVRWPQPPPGLPPVVPLTTSYEVHPDRGFLPASASAIKAGLLDVGDRERWEIATVDVDGAVGRLRAAAATVAATAEEQPRLPALRSAGIALLRRDRAEEFTRRRTMATETAARASAAGMPALTAEDLVLGLRVDVRFKGGERWTSLCRRLATYSVDDRAVGTPAEEEGHVKAGAAVRHEDGVLRADEVVARWSGWSLAVPSARPGSRAGEGRRAAVPFDFRWEFDVPAGSLLPLRFGHDYQLRVRVADLAGGGVPPSNQDLSLATPPIPYVRYEPVASPVVELAPELEAAKLGPGGSLEDIVIRSDAPDYPRNDARVLRAPSTTLDVAEQHGELDGADEATFAVVRRALADGHLPDPAAEGVTLFSRPAPRMPPQRTLFPGWPGEWPDAAPMRLELLPRDPGPVGPEGLITVLDDVIRVRLAPAEQLVLELSSFLKAGFLDHLALQQWRSTDAPVQVVKDGRHPLATPARTLTLVHAVRRPFGTPAGVFKVERTPGATDATLVPTSRLMGVDPASTAEVQIAASWRDVDDATVTEVRDAPVPPVPVARDTTLLPRIRHELGSTRHRKVSYTLTAVSRFRHLFNADEDPERFVTRGTLAPVSVPSTVRPQAPHVVTVVPSFAWSEEENTPPGVIVRHRLGGRLRVELARPWFTTGEGEFLGVVLAEKVPVLPELRAFASEVARDPVFFSFGPPPDRWLRPERFQGMIGPPATVPLAERKGMRVVVAPYMVHPHEGGWSVDVSARKMEDKDYRPFVRLVVARYQPQSVPGLELSPVVRCPLVQILPDRTLTVDASADSQVSVTLAGRGPRGESNRVDVLLERCLVPQGGSADGVTATAFGGAPPQGVAAWVAVGGAVVSGGLGQPLTLPLPVGVGPLRVRVREVERLQPDAATPSAGTGAELAERLIFTDLVALP